MNQFQHYSTRKFLSGFLVLAIAGFMFTSCEDGPKEYPEDSFSSIYENHKKGQNVQSFDLKGEYAAMFIPKEEEELKELMNEVGQLKLITSPDKATATELKNAFENTLSKDQYQELLDLSDGGNKVIIKSDEAEGKIKELVILVSDDKGAFSAMSVDGNLDKEKVLKLLNEADFSQLKNMDSSPF